MSQNREQIYLQAIELCKDKQKMVVFIEDLIVYLPISKPTFYDYYPPDSNELNAIKALINENKVNMKVSIRAKLHKGDGGGAGLLALYKLICTDDERKKLSMTHVDHTTKGNALGSAPMSKEDFKELDDRIESEY